MASLSTIKPGDIVEVDKKGRKFFAVVEDKQDGGLALKPITHGVSYRTASAREVTAHWRKTKNARRFTASVEGNPFS